MPNVQIHRGRSTTPAKTQTNEEKCAEQWIREGSKKWVCATPTCEHTYSAKKELQRHNLYYFYQKTESAYKTLAEMHQLKKLDRGKQLQEGIHREATEKRQQNTKYNIETGKWECKLYPKQYDQQSMRNAIQHARKRKKQNHEQNNPIWKEWAKKQQQIRNCRIRALNTINTSKTQTTNAHTTDQQITH